MSRSEKSNQSQIQREEKIIFIEHNRFVQIYLLSLNLSSFEVVGLNLLGQPISAAEYRFVISHTIKQGVSTDA